VSKSSDGWTNYFKTFKAVTVLVYLKRIYNYLKPYGFPHYSGVVISALYKKQTTKISQWLLIQQLKTKATISFLKARKSR
jgi:hypothetical protein